MRLLILVGGFHEELSLEELKALDVRILERDGRLILGEKENWEELKRLGYTHKILKFLGKIEDGNSDIELPFEPEKEIKGSYAVRSKDFESTGNFEKNKKELQDKIWKSLSDREVDLESPQTEINFFFKGKKIYAGKLLHSFDSSEFTKRKVQYRPFFHPVSFHPREGRVFINLSKVKKGEKLLDPFVGTGGILIEGGLIGCKIYGSDFSREMVQGTKINLDYFGLSGKIKRVDARNLVNGWKEEIPFDSIVTDPPYGSASKVGGKDIEKLYEEFLAQVPRVLKNNKYCVVSSPKLIKMDNLIPDKLKLLTKFEEKIHKSLTREIFVLKNKI